MLQNETQWFEIVAEDLYDYGKFVNEVTDDEVSWKLRYTNNSILRNATSFRPHGGVDIVQARNFLATDLYFDATSGSPTNYNSVFGFIRSPDAPYPIMQGVPAGTKNVTFQNVVIKVTPGVNGRIVVFSNWQDNTTTQVNFTNFTIYKDLSVQSTSWGLMDVGGSYCNINISYYVTNGEKYTYPLFSFDNSNYNNTFFGVVHGKLNNTNVNKYYQGGGGSNHGNIIFYNN